MELISGLALVAGLMLLVGGLVAASPAVASVGLVASLAGGYMELSSGRLSTVAALLLALGVTALLAEVFLPSGLAGASGALLLSLALVAGWDASILLTIPVAAASLVALAWLKISGETRGLFDPGTLPFGAARSAPPVPPGSEGRAVTALRPGGTARFDGVDREVRLRAGSAGPGAVVRAVATEDMVLLVDLADEG